MKFSDLQEAKRSAKQTVSNAKKKKLSQDQLKKKMAFRVKQKQYRLQNEEDLSEAPLVMSGWKGGASYEHGLHHPNCADFK